jgi:hypothetical protein
LVFLFSHDVVMNTGEQCSLDDQRFHLFSMHMFHNYVRMYNCGALERYWLRR